MSAEDAPILDSLIIYIEVPRVTSISSGPASLLAKGNGEEIMLVIPSKMTKKDGTTKGSFESWDLTT